MPKPMTLVLWGSIISIVGALIGGTIVAIGKYRQDVSSSKKSDSILFNTEEGLGISKITREGVKELIEQRDKLDNQVNELLRKQEDLKNGQDTLGQKLEPFINYAHKMFPNLSTDEALTRLEELLNKQAKELIELKNKLKPRSLTEKQSEDIISYLKELPKGKVNISSPMGNSEAASYASQFETILKSAGWEVTASGIGWSSLTGGGLIIITSREDDTDAIRLKQALLKNGVEAGGHLGKDGLAKETVLLFIGDKL